MKITIVMGIPGSGKSHYIKEHFSDRKVYDLYTYQEKKKFLTYETVLESYEELKDDIVNALKRGENIVIEHTLLKAIRRTPYIEAIREVTDDPIDIVVLYPPIEVLKERQQQRGIFHTEDSIKADLELLEIPTTDEGFSEVTIIKE